MQDGQLMGLACLNDAIGAQLLCQRKPSFRQVRHSNSGAEHTAGLCCEQPDQSRAETQDVLCAADACPHRIMAGNRGGPQESR